MWKFSEEIKMPKRYRTRISREELDDSIIPVNHVLVEMQYSAVGAKTKSGIIYGFDVDEQYQGEDAHAADCAEVWGIVVKVPQKLYFNPDDENNSMPWDCEMELQEGDRVWFSALESKNSVELECEGKVYKSIPYMDCFVAIRDMSGKVIMLNSYVLCTPLKKESLSSLDTISKDKIDMTKGIIAFCGNPVKRYLREQYCDLPDLREGDMVQFDAKTPLYYLERKGYTATFDGDNLYWVVQRRRIVMILNR